MNHELLQSIVYLLYFVGVGLFVGLVSTNPIQLICLIVVSILSDVGMHHILFHGNFFQ